MFGVRPLLLTVAVCLPLAACRGPSKAELALAEQLNVEAAATNARVRLPFDPAVDTVVTDVADTLVRDFAAPVAFREEWQGRGARQFTAFRLIRHSDCRSEPELDPIYGRPGVCLLQTYEAPPARAYRLVMSHRPAERNGTKITRYDLTLAKPGGRGARLAFFGTGIIEPHKWAPLVAHAFGLEERSAALSTLPDLIAASRWIEASRSGETGDDHSSLAELSRTGQLLNSQGMSANRIPPTMIAEYAEGLVAQFAKGLTDPNSHANLELLARLLTRLPAEEWTRRLPHILAVISRAPEVDPQLLGDLGPRLGDAGVIAEPAMIRFADDGGVTILPVAQGVCRMGKAASPAIREATLSGWRTVNRPDFNNRRSRSSLLRRSGSNIWRQEQWKRCKEARQLPPPDTLDGIYGSRCWRPTALHDNGRALYLALKRMGLGEQADALALHRDRADYKRRFADVGPGSPNDICLTEHEARARGWSAPQ